MIKSLSYLVLICFFGVLVIALIVLLTGCVDTNRTLPSKPRFSGDHATSSIRDLWIVCYHTRLRYYPQVPPPMQWSYCDCMIDKSREAYSSLDYEKIPQDNLSSFFTITSLECDEKMSVPSEPVELPIKQL